MNKRDQVIILLLLQNTLMVILDEKSPVWLVFMAIYFCLIVYQLVIIGKKLWRDCHVQD